MAELADVVTRLQKQLSRCSSHRAAKEVTWSWVCAKLLSILSNYPSGVTDAIILAELYQELQSGGGKITSSFTHKPQKKTTISSVVEVKSVFYESVLEVRAKPPLDIPGTTTKIIHLSDSDDGSHQVEMYLHRKYYDLAHILTTHVLRMTCCRLVPKGRQNSPLRLLPTEHLVVLLDPAEENEYQRRFTALAQFQSGSISQPDYIASIWAKVVDIGSEEVVHSPDGTVFKRLVVQLAHSSGEHTIPLVLWDEYVGFARLFEKGDMLYIERPYSKPTGDGLFCLEHGPATVFYVIPFEPPQEILPSQHPRQQTQILVKKTENDKLDFSTYPERLTAADIVPNMINGVLLALCQEIGCKELIVEDSCAAERFELLVADETDTIELTILDPGSRLFERIYSNQWLLLCGVHSVLGENGKVTLVCHLGKGASIYNVSALPGRLMSPILCSPIPLREAISLTGELSEVTTVARISGWFCTSGDELPVERLHCTCRQRVKVTSDGFLCEHCSVSQLKELRERNRPRELSDEHHYWRWKFSLRVTLQDNMGSSIRVTFASSVAEVFLQRSPVEVSAMSSAEQLELFRSYTESDQKYTFCISKMGSTFQANCVSRTN